MNAVALGSCYVSQHNDLVLNYHHVVMHCGVPIHLYVLIHGEGQVLNVLMHCGVPIHFYVLIHGEGQMVGG